MQRLKRHNFLLLVYSQSVLVVIQVIRFGGDPGDSLMF